MAKRDQVEQLQLALDEQKRKYRDDIEMAQKIIRIGLEALSVRMLTTLVLVADCVIFSWALYAAGWQQLLSAVLFAVASWSVLYLRPPERKERET